MLKLQHTKSPIISKESRQVRNDDYWKINARIINLQTCKIVHLSVNRSSNQSFTTSWSQLLSGIPSDLRPSQDVYVGIGRHNVDLRLKTDGTIDGISNSSKSATFTITFTYVVI